MKYIFFLLGLFFFFSGRAQDSILVKTNKEDVVYVIVPKEKKSAIKQIVPFLPLVSIVVACIGLFGIAYQISERRKDDNLKNQLERLNKQITDFYGPLYSLYETGHQNYYAFLELYGNEFHFNNPHYKQWDIAIFQPTNFAMENIIITKADLIIGNTVPAFFFQFCEWLTTHKAYFNAEAQPNFDNEAWKPVRDKYEHPQDRMRMYIKASFEVLKKTQGKVLSSTLKSINEEDLINEIIQIEKEILNDPDTNQWEKSVWKRVTERAEFNEKRAQQVRVQEETLIENSRIPDHWRK